MPLAYFLEYNRQYSTYMLYSYPILNIFDMTELTDFFLKKDNLNCIYLYIIVH